MRSAEFNAVEHHLALALTSAKKKRADLVWGGGEAIGVVGGLDPLPEPGERRSVHQIGDEGERKAFEERGGVKRLEGGNQMTLGPPLGEGRWERGWAEALQQGGRR